jgi:hypothetical protein
MAPNANVVHERVLWAVGTVLDNGWGADRNTVTQALVDALTAAEVLWNDDAWRTLENHWEYAAGLVVQYLEHDPRDKGARSAHAELRGLIDEAFGFLAQDLASALAASGRHPEASMGEVYGYESPALHSAVHDGTAFVAEAGTPKATAAVPARDYEPGAAKRRKAECAERALDAAHKVLEALDWQAIDQQNGHTLKSMDVAARLCVLWVKDRGVIIVGKDNPAFQAVEKVRDVPGIEIFAGSLQLLARPHWRRSQGSAEITGIPQEEADAISERFNAYKITVSLVPPRGPGVRRSGES